MKKSILILGLTVFTASFMLTSCGSSRCMGKGVNFSSIDTTNDYYTTVAEEIDCEEAL